MPDVTQAERPVAIIGAGFTGLAAAYELTRAGRSVVVFDGDTQPGGLAGSFDLAGTQLEKFYHHWFTNDEAVMTLIRDLGCEDHILLRPTRTGLYYANHFFKLSTPTDLLKFSALSFPDRIRLGLLALRARRVKDWKELENLTAKEWLTKLGGKKVYEVVWEPLLKGKFGPYAETVSAVWFWNKLKLRGGSRAKDGAENLAYYEGGFASLAQRLAEEVQKQGGEIRLGETVTGLHIEKQKVLGVKTNQGEYPAAQVLATCHLPQFAELLEDKVAPTYLKELRGIPYLANVCLVLILNRSLSDLYWINVNDPSFPFVGIIEHTNFEPAGTYQGKRVVYLSKYLPETEALYQMSPQEVVDFSLPHIQRMFPDFEPSWIEATHVWKARYSQPVVEMHYSAKIPPFETPVENLYLASMAQIYPEDRGTNYAVREGRKAGKALAVTRPTAEAAAG